MLPVPRSELKLPTTEVFTASVEIVAAETVRLAPDGAEISTELGVEMAGVETLAETAGREGKVRVGRAQEPSATVVNEMMVKSVLVTVRVEVKVEMVGALQDVKVEVVVRKGSMVGFRALREGLVG